MRFCVLVIATALLGAAPLLNPFVPSAAAQESVGREGVVPQGLVVSRLLDGTTYLLSDGRRVQLVGVEATPPLARRYARDLVLGRRVALEASRAGGALVYLYVLDEAGQRRYEVGEELLRAGYGTVYTQHRFSRLDPYLRLQQEALNAKRGLWGADPYEGFRGRHAWMETHKLPPRPTCPLSSETADLLSGCAHHPDCRWVSSEGGGLGLWQSRRGGRCPCAQ